MATLILAAAGAVFGQSFGLFGVVAGRAIGALAGAALDRVLAGSGGTVERGKLADLSVQASIEGAAIPRLYGRARLAGQVIWATELEETVTSEGGGGKGGPEVETYRYFANFAVGLCEGPIARIGRVWANGHLLDLDRITMRVHPGDETQMPDSLIEARQGADGAPAYRGLAYVVFERLPLADFGNALPQLSFEVFRPVGRLERMIRAVTLIPGATEFGYHPTPVTRAPEDGVSEAENVHTPIAATDVIAALDELQDLCPRLESLAIVVSWFGDDLRADACSVRPRAERTDKVTRGATWRVAGLTRAAAGAVSSLDDRPAFGGTPSDASVAALIREAKARGLAVTLYPFVMMDVAPGNARVDPYTGATPQPAYPWRGRITCDPAPGRPGSPDGTAAIEAVVAAFVGAAAPGHFTGLPALDTVAYAGPAEWSYRRLILHYAALAEVAGGVDGFLIGSELRGLTALNDGARGHPFVAALRSLAADVKAMLRPGTEVGYAADWSEYANHRPDDGSGDVTFHLDPLWADPNIDFVGIDAYLPLTDWREGDHLDAAIADGPADRAYLAASVAGGELYDWYYASDADRAAQLRSPITDGAAGKPWVFRIKDFSNWWGNLHVDRVGGVEVGTPTAWVPGLKPIRFTEIGCPAVDNGGNEPNVFPDLVSSEGRPPHHSRGLRDDLVQRRYLEVLLGHFDPAEPEFAAGHNPLSPVDGRRMVDVARAHVWSYDARPFPAFPLATDVWADGANWTTGHWLNGRLGTAPLADLVAAAAAEQGIGAVDSSGLSGLVDGCVFAGRTTLRDGLESLATLFRFDVIERPDGLLFRDRGRRSVATIGAGDLVETRDGPLVELRRAQAEDLPVEVAVGFLDGSADYLQTSVAARRVAESAGPARVLDLQLPIVAAPEVLAGHAEAMIKELDAARERLRFVLPPSFTGLEPGDTLTLALPGYPATVAVERTERTEAIVVEARVIDRTIRARAGRTEPRALAAGIPVALGPPRLEILDVPAASDDAGVHAPRIAASARPWPGALSVLRAAGSGYQPVQRLDAPAVIGRLNAPLGPGPLWRFDRTGVIDVTLLSGTLASVDLGTLFDGANLAAVAAEGGGWELVQFANAELIGPRRYRLTTLLRGQLGTGDAMAAGHAAGASFVMIGAATPRLALGIDFVGRSAALRIVPAAAGSGSDAAIDRTVTIGGRALRPLPPVRIRAVRVGGDVEFGWIRQTRSGGDGWEQAEVPLAEEREAYSVDILDGASVVRTLAVTEPRALYTAAAQAADFGTMPATFDVVVCQISTRMGRGLPGRATLHV
ncbi:baseplate multidomain protein megatron [Methylobrevis albus]|uniref:Glycoside hydrolase/phage tail family protein n=1 Tax=Methylobrevis albus TaxID=2793297 RepID=A0A931I007_9HYPH|nr:glycoside hydrolase/phage tail family protein [Methylobrevis albus]MBH0237600.1 glycoside hydrolase/phage tail family protein [Methylobrevis albus]